MAIKEYSPLQIVFKRSCWEFKTKEECEDFAKQIADWIESYEIGGHEKLGYFRIDWKTKPLRKCRFCRWYQPAEGFAVPQKLPFKCKVCAECLEYERKKYNL